MKLNIVMVITVMSLGLMFNASLFADEKGSPKGSMMDEKITAKVTESGAIKVGNKICPISKEEVGDDEKKITTYEYQGKIYNLCCARCLMTFKKNPEKYIQMIDEDDAGERDHAHHDHDHE